ncbi:dihydroxyacetone kinase, phosphotransfer subunit [Halobacteroides halobius DSM 5150]|uniref:phosphoenolpyruvate--glycerone phosphotransferase n=1 Tax=Halobacteroides halobius (strain ATCC 35273 / DSM 5150 / MD-1) TaxID=748449 RepID=L0KCY4_HALHC|nr:dihydroxyacetone kinase phosphoryl donor subunit DhaM [Halobacteroides halobius]AGB41938.1 dihydroxyacetone kinase, phosphotransfer subunit [Halobacteroides halobius DSM 5150]
MIGIVLVSHSRKLAEGIEELALEMIPRKIPLVSIGGDEDGRIGTDIDEIIEAVKEVYSENGVLIIGDVGSSLMNSKEALDILELDGYENVAVSGAPLVEGAMIAAVEANLGKGLREIKRKVESKRIIEWI